MPPADYAASKRAAVEINAETDFVARNDLFQARVSGVTKLALVDADVEALKGQAFGNGRTVAEELTHLVATAAGIGDRPSAIRYPRGEGTGVARPAEGVPLEIGKGRIVKEGSGIAILSFGTRLPQVLMAAEKMAAYGLSPTIADARFAKPLDTDLIRRLAAEHEVLITIEEGAAGGFGSHVMQFLAWDGAMDRGLKIRPMVLPDIFQDQDTPERMYQQAGLDADGIVRAALSALGRGEEAARVGKNA